MHFTPGQRTMRSGTTGKILQSAEALAPSRVCIRQRTPDRSHGTLLCLQGSPTHPMCIPAIRVDAHHVHAILHGFLRGTPWPTDCSPGGHLCLQVFSQLKLGLQPLIAKVKASTSKPSAGLVKGDWDTAEQAALCKEIAIDMGFELSNGRYLPVGAPHSLPPCEVRPNRSCTTR